MRWPALLKPDQGGSGARIHLVESMEAVEEIFSRDPAVWLPDNLFLLQEYLPHDPEEGIVRLEFLGGELLYAMRVKTHGRFNLCPSPVCNPEEGAGTCAAADRARSRSGRVFSVPGGAKPWTRWSRSRRLDVGGIDIWRRLMAGALYDINANSNLRPSSPRRSASIPSTDFPSTNASAGEASAVFQVSKA
jgi:hypothetical protein